MLLIANRLNQLSQDKLLELYSESIQRSAIQNFPWESEKYGIQRAEDDFVDYLRHAFFRTPGACYAVWVEGDRYISALRLEPYEDGALISALETAVSFRKQGYASKLLTAVREQYAGKLYSHVDKTNKASLRTHIRCGFQKRTEYAHYLDGSISTAAYTLMTTGMKQ